MKYKVTHSTVYQYSESVPLCHNEVHLTPREHGRQYCLSHRLAVRPAPARLEHTRDYFGNHRSLFTIQEGHQRLAVTAVSKVEVLPPVGVKGEQTSPWETVRDRLNSVHPPLHLESRQYLYDSPHIIRSRELAEFAEVSFPSGRLWLDGVTDLMDRIFHEFTYDPAATNISTPLHQVLAMRRGVCQDFAHLMIGGLRALGLSARYVSGYLLTMPLPGQPKLIGADASHAWLSAYSPETGWVDFDPTNNCIPSVDHITLAWGRDYSDVCPIKGVFIGGGQHGLTVSVDVSPLTEAARELE
ncbi:MAG: transglutaminase family protein [Pirellulales bacterium]|nr:transglutaminase family protein [Pirellulales bacterium]